jgi:hypothetical protein
MNEEQRRELDADVLLGQAIGYSRAATWLLKMHPQRDALSLLLAQARSEAESLALLERSPSTVVVGVAAAFEELTQGIGGAMGSIPESTTSTS